MARIRFLLNNDAIPPKRAHENDAGFDLFAPTGSTHDAQIVIPPHSTIRIDTKVVVDLPVGTFARIETRSSLAALGVIAIGGIIDPDYTGSLVVLLHNLNSEERVIAARSAVAQLVVYPRLSFPVEIGIFSADDSVIAAKNAGRGARGFGSTDAVDARALRERIEKRGVAWNLGPKGDGWNMSQQPDELAYFLADMQRLGVRSALEIGTGSGGLSKFMAEEMGWSVTSVDIAQTGDQKSERAVYICGDSKTVELPDQSYDLIFIDGDHSYAGVSADYARFKPMANKAIAFHDVSGQTGASGVYQFWLETAYDAERMDFKRGCYQVICTDPDRAPGIGWIVLSEFER